MPENSVAEEFSLLGISLCVISLRLVSRISLVGTSKLQMDDYLMALAGIFYTAEVVIAYYIIVFKGLTNGPMTAEQRASLDSSSQEWHDRVSGSKNQLAGWTVYTLVLWTLKLCMLLFYTRLTDNVTNMKIRIKTGAYLLPATFLAVECVTLFACNPVRKHWQINPDPGGHCNPAHSFPTIYTVIFLNVFTDFYLMYIPLPMVIKARLPTKKKLGLIAMFMGGILTTIAGILRCALIITAGSNGARQAGSWSVRESFIAVCVTNVPMIYPFVARVYSRMTLTADSSKASRPNSHHLRPLKETSHQSSKKKKPSPYSIPQTTVLGSKDRIPMIPTSNVDIEAGSDTDSTRDTVWQSQPHHIRVVTKFGIRSSSARSKEKVGQSAGAFWTDRS